jgi:hypothetical protein
MKDACSSTSVFTAPVGELDAGRILDAAANAFATSQTGEVGRGRARESVTGGVRATA